MRVELILGAHLFIGERAAVAVRYKYVDIKKNTVACSFFVRLSLLYHPKGEMMPLCL